MIPYASGILTVVLPSISGQSDERTSSSIRDVAASLNESLMCLIKPEDDKNEGSVSSVENAADVDAHKDKIKIALEGEVISDVGDVARVRAGEPHLDVNAIVEVLSKEIPSPKMGTELACLRWFHHLLSTIPRQTFQHMGDISPALLRALADPEHEVRSSSRFH